MTIHLIQSDLVWEDPEANRKHLKELIGIPTEGGIIILPEMFNTGFTFPSDRSTEVMSGPTLKWMQSLAKELGCVLTGSLIIVDEAGRNRNRMCWVEPEGRVLYYDKRHLFRMGGEDERFTAGENKLIVEWRGLKVCLQVCYDLRFPVWSRNTFQQGKYEYDLLIYVANWPAARHHAWQGLLRARAMENIAYCAGVNRVGKDENGLVYRGGSALIDPVGIPILESDAEEGHVTLELDLQFLHNFREKFPVGRDADGFTLS